MTAPTPLSRKAIRLPIELRGRLHPRSGRALEVTLSDISEDGCCIAFAGETLEVGQAVVIQPGSLEALVGRVVWTIHGRAGLRFAQPLDGPVVEHLHRNNRAYAAIEG